MKGAIVVLLLAVLQADMSNAVDPKVFFTSAKDNLTQIVWAHAVNSAKDLADNLAKKTELMLEADVKMGKKTDSNTADDVPIMSHDNKTSDLTLQDFVDKVNQTSGINKGVKLDFKETDAVTKSKDILDKLNNAPFPVFLNADILKGSAADKEPAVNKDTFLNTVKVYKNVILSLGWTTTDGKKDANYTDEDVNGMLKVVKDSQLNQSMITYAVRASAASVSHKQMENLLKNTDSTLTVWSGKNDTVDEQKLSELVKHIGVNKVYLDVTDELKNKLDLNGASGMTVATMTILGSLFVSLFLNGMPRSG
ncbi:protein FAM151B isoform X1 [Megalopta genalis]|uniref:protein FAM151B isoform X1 n=2 Tax=Megalopta genalis TaxID=115081 RepID=UPI003FD0A714